MIYDFYDFKLNDMMNKLKILYNNTEDIVKLYYIDSGVI